MRCNIKQSCIFHLILHGNSPSLILSLKNRGNVIFCLFFILKPEILNLHFHSDHIGPFWGRFKLPFFIHFHEFFCDKYSILTYFATFYCFFLYYLKKKKKLEGDGKKAYIWTAKTILNHYDYCLILSQSTRNLIIEAVLFNHDTPWITFFFYPKIYGIQELNKFKI